MILYGVITKTSIGRLFITGILPGIMMALLLSTLIVILVVLKPEIAQRVTRRVTIVGSMRASGETAQVVLIALAVTVSIYSGFATQTEAGAVAAVAAAI